MSQTASSNEQNYKVIPLSSTALGFYKQGYKETIYTVFAFTTAILLIALGLRLLLAMLVVDNFIMRGLVFITAPFVAPFTHFFHDQNEMVQISTASAFTTYYAVYWLGALSSRIFRRSSPTLTT